MSKWWLLALVPIAACSHGGSRDDAPVGPVDDSPAYIVNMPDKYHNFSIKCIGGNGLYAHTRAAAPVVVVDDPLCAEGGFIREALRTE